MTDYVLFSIDNVTDTHTLAKFLRYYDTKVAMGETKGYLGQCIGSYQGRLEVSFICRFDDYKKFIQPMDFTKYQESVWLVAGDRMKVYDLDSGKRLGRLEQVTKEEAFKAKGFTYRPDMDVYWVLK